MTHRLKFHLFTYICTIVRFYISAVAMCSSRTDWKFLQWICRWYISNISVIYYFGSCCIKPVFSCKYITDILFWYIDIFSNWYIIVIFYLWYIADIFNYRSDISHITNLFFIDIWLIYHWYIDDMIFQIYRWTNIHTDISVIYSNIILIYHYCQYISLIYRRYIVIYQSCKILKWNIIWPI